MEKHSSLHLHSGHRVLVKEIKTYSANSAALLSDMDRLHKGDSPGSSGGEGCRPLDWHLAWPGHGGSQERTAAGCLPRETFELGDLQGPLLAQWSSRLGLHLSPLEGLLKPTLLPERLTQGVWSLARESAFLVLVMLVFQSPDHTQRGPLSWSQVPSPTC